MMTIKSGKFLEKIRKNPRANRFFIPVVGGIIISIVLWFHFPPDYPKIARITIIWMSISMGLYWAVDRILHAVAGAAGETERDGIIWLVPIALGWIPVALGWIISFQYLFLSIFVYCFVSYTLVTICRPEIHPARHPVVGENGLNSWRNLFRLLQYKMDVVEHNLSSTLTIQPGKFRFFSMSYFFYTACFGGVALIASTREGSNIKYMGEAISMIVTGTAALITIVFATAFTSQISKEEEIPWPIQKLEAFVLSFLFIVVVIYLIAFLYWAKELYLN